MRPSPEDIRDARLIWDYMFLGHEPVESDVIIGLGSHDLGVADDVAELYFRKMAPTIVFCGNVGRTTSGLFPATEASMLRDRAIRLGVPGSAVLVEESSTNTGENIVFTQRLLERSGIIANQILLVHKPYMLRRDYATFMQQWRGADDVRLACWAKPVTFTEYLASSNLEDSDTIAIMVGDLQRINRYPEYGFQIEQDIPHDVWSAYGRLVQRGYDAHLIG